MSTTDTLSQPFLKLKCYHVSFITGCQDGSTAHGEFLARVKADATADELCLGLREMAHQQVVESQCVRSDAPKRPVLLSINRLNCG
jgi:hypothetical protein